MSNQSDLEQMHPFTTAIADEIKAMSEDTEGKFHKRSEELLEYAQYFRTGLVDCCAMHRFEQIAEIQMAMHSASENCTCGDVLNHDLLKAVRDIIGNHMNQCVKDAVFTKLLAGRVN